MRRRRHLEGRRVLQGRAPPVPLGARRGQPAARDHPGAPRRRREDGPAAAASEERAGRILGSVRVRDRDRQRARRARAGRPRTSARCTSATGCSPRSARTITTRRIPATSRRCAAARRCAGRRSERARRCSKRCRRGAATTRAPGSPSCATRCARTAAESGCRWAVSSTRRAAGSTCGSRSATPRAPRTRSSSSTTGGAVITLVAPCSADACSLELDGVKLRDGAFYPRVGEARLLALGDLRELEDVPRLDSVPRVPARLERRRPRRRRLARRLRQLPRRREPGSGRRGQGRAGATPARNRRRRALAEIRGVFVIAARRASGHPGRMKLVPSSASPRIRRVVLVAFPDAQVLDVTGPLEVFANANRRLDAQEDRRSPRYSIEIVAPPAGAAAHDVGHPARRRPRVPRRARADRHAARGGRRGHPRGAARSRAHRLPPPGCAARAPRGLDLLGHVPARRSRSARRQARDHALGVLRGPRAALPEGPGRDGPHLRARRQRSGARPACARAWTWRSRWPRRTTAASSRSPWRSGW